MNSNIAVDGMSLECRWVVAAAADAPAPGEGDVFGQELAVAVALLVEKAPIGHRPGTGGVTAVGAGLGQVARHHFFQDAAFDQRHPHADELGLGEAVDHLGDHPALGDVHRQLDGADVFQVGRDQRAGRFGRLGAGVGQQRLERQGATGGDDTDVVAVEIQHPADQARGEAHVRIDEQQMADRRIGQSVGRQEAARQFQVAGAEQLDIRLDAAAGQGARHMENGRGIGGMHHVVGAGCGDEHRHAVGLPPPPARRTIGGNVCRNPRSPTSELSGQGVTPA